MNDRELIQAYARDGSPGAMAEIVERHWAKVYSACYRVLGEAHAAEDAAQATFIVLMRKAAGLAPETLLSGWLYLTAVTSAQQWRRAAARRAQHEKEAAVAKARSGPELDETWDVLRPELDTLLAALPRPQREALVLRYFDGRSHAEAARELGCAVDTVHSRIKRGLASLRERFRRKGMHVGVAMLGTLLSEHALEAVPAGSVASFQAVCWGEQAAAPVALEVANAVLSVLAWAKIKVSVGMAVATVGFCVSAGVSFCQFGDHSAPHPQTNAALVEPPPEAPCEPYAPGQVRTEFRTAASADDLTAGHQDALDPGDFQQPAHGASKEGQAENRLNDHTLCRLIGDRAGQEWQAAQPLKHPQQPAQAHPVARVSAAGLPPGAAFPSPPSPWKRADYTGVARLPSTPSRDRSHMPEPPETDDRNGATASSQAARLDRDPLQDLAAWSRGSPYHEATPPAVLESTVEAAESLENPLAGPAPSTSYYGKLAGMLDPAVQAQAPGPLQMLSSLDFLWEHQWRHTLGFAIDPGSKRLAADLERAERAAREARERLTGLLKRAAACAVSKLQLHDQLAFAARENESAADKVDGLRAQFDRRMLFIQALTAVLRLAPDGNFGPALLQLQAPATQASAARVLAQVGPLSAETVWKGLALDMAWLAEHESVGAGKAGDEPVRRRQAVEAAQALLLDPRLDGLGAVCGFIRENPVALSAVLRKAFELLDRLGTLNLRPETLATLPQLLAHVKNEKPGVAERARWVLLRILGVRAGKVSMEDAVRYLAPLVEAQDMQLAEAAHAFLNYHTGQNLPRETQAWLALHQRMKTERERIKTEQDKVASRR